MKTTFYTALVRENHRGGMVEEIFEFPITTEEEGEALPMAQAAITTGLRSIMTDLIFDAAKWLSLIHI